MKKMSLIVALKILVCYSAFAQTNNVNTYDKVFSIVNNTITVRGDQPYMVGDVLLLIQMTGSLLEETDQSAGNYELLTVKQVNTNIISVDSIKRKYSPNDNVVQLVKVAKYESLDILNDITALPYDPYSGTGGVVAISVCNKLSLHANIDVIAKGFGGANTHEADSIKRFGAIVSQGLGTSSAYSNTHKVNERSMAGGIGGGGGMLYDANDVPLMNRCGGGGGGGIGGGGGGGGNAGGGGIVGMGGMSAMGVYKEWKREQKKERSHVYIYRRKFIVMDTVKRSEKEEQPIIAGESGQDAEGFGYFSEKDNKVFMGGGGGYELGMSPNGHAGSGGGIIIIMAGEIEGNGHSIIADGGTSYHISNCDSTNSAYIDHFGGGGGGQVLIQCPKITGNLILSAKGGNSNSCQGYGGGGGGGGIWSATELSKNVQTYIDGGRSINLTTKPDAQNGGKGLVIMGGLMLNMDMNCGCQPPITACDDNNCQTRDSFNKLTCECEHIAMDMLDCDDNNCSTVDEFNAAICDCVHKPIQPIECDDNNCLTLDTYNSLLCECEHKELPIKVCDDYNENTMDIYNELTCECEYLSRIVANNNGISKPNTSNYVGSASAISTPIVELVLPSAFSPNNDGMNDTFGILNPDDVAEVNFIITNRWNQVVFQTMDKDARWDGTRNGELLPLGMYFYQIKYRSSNQNNWSLKQGSITLIR